MVELFSVIKVILLAMTPIGELRVALPVALAVYKMPMALAFCASVLGNLIPPLFLLLFLKPTSIFLSKKSALFEKFFAWLFTRTAKRASGAKTWLGLALFVAIPLPMTGAWTGAVIAFLLKMPFKKAFSAIATGVLAAAILVAVLTKTGVAINNYFGWQILLVLGLILCFLELLRHSEPSRAKNPKEILREEPSE